MNAHAAQQAMARRREQERKAVLAGAVAEMRHRGRPECEMADLFMDFKGIQVTLAVMAKALIRGSIDCKTAGRLLVELQTMSKLLWLYHRVHRGTQREKALTTKDTKEHEGLPQICAEERRLNKSLEPGLPAPPTALTPLVGRDTGGEDPGVAVETKILTFTQSRRGCRDGPWQQVRAA